MSGQSKSFWWAIGSAIAAVLGSFGPWAKVLGFITVSGTDGDGWYVILAAGIAAALIVERQRRGLGHWPIYVAIASSVIASLIAIYDWSNLSRVANESGLISAGWGIYLATLGSISLAAACIKLALEARSDTRQAPEVPQART